MAKKESLLVPLLLLLSLSLTATAKLVWIVLLLDEDMETAKWLSPQRLARRTGRARSTIRRAIAQLTATGWLEIAESGEAKLAKHDGDYVKIPIDLILIKWLHPQCTVLFGLLQKVPTYQNFRGEFTFPSLSQQVPFGIKALRRAFRKLASARWVQFSQDNRLAPIKFSLQSPDLAEVAQAEKRIDEAEHKGEAIASEICSLLVDGKLKKHYEPPYLINPVTKGQMHFDIYYKDEVSKRAVALEFNGDQHCHATDMYPEDVVAKQQALDKIKDGLCDYAHVDLLNVRPENLSVDGIRRIIDGKIPLRDLKGHEPLVAYLEKASAAYRRAYYRMRKAANELPPVSAARL